MSSLVVCERVRACTIVYEHVQRVQRVRGRDKRSATIALAAVVRAAHSQQSRISLVVLIKSDVNLRLVGRRSTFLYYYHNERTRRDEFVVAIKARGVRRLSALSSLESLTDSHSYSLTLTLTHTRTKLTLAPVTHAHVTRSRPASTHPARREWLCMRPFIDSVCSETGNCVR